MKLAINGGRPVLENYVREEWNNITEEDSNLIKKYVNNNEISVIDGGILKEFEDLFAKFIGTKYAVAYCNGTAALHAASFACGAHANNNFILSEYSYHGTVNSVLENSGEVILCDYDEKTLDINMEKAEKQITDKTKGIIITHCWGNPVNMDCVKKSKKNII